MRLGHFVGIGSNVNPSVNVARAISALLAISPELSLSRVLQTQPVGIASEAPFLNAVVYLHTRLDKKALKHRLNMIEEQLGRDRSDPERGRKDRTIDLDLLLSMKQDSTAVDVVELCTEAYYRPQMLELARVLGLECLAAGEVLNGATEIEFGGERIGLKPVRISQCEQRPTVTERKAALVTGAAVRLGRAIATSLAKAGYDIALHYNGSHEAALQAAAEIEDHGVRCKLFKYDLGQVANLDLLMAAVTDAFPHLAVLVNNASAYDPGTIIDTTPEQLDRQWTVNFKAPFFLLKEFCRRIDSGSVINVLDNKIAFNQYQYVAYLSSKKALAELTRMAALEFAPRIRVNAVAPGVILPSSVRSEDYLQWRKQGIPALEVGHPGHVCSVVQDMLANLFITGQILFVDGGEAINVVGRNAATFATLASV